jgi:hypothetical protein
MLGVVKTCMKLKLSFYEFLGARLGLPGTRIPTLPILSVPPPHKPSKGGNLPRLRRFAG